MIGFVYASWARGLAGDKQWKAALDKCAEGLKAVPNQARLLQAVRVIVDEWADAAIKATKWDEAIGIYDVGLSYLPGDSHLQHNKEMPMLKTILECVMKTDLELHNHMKKQ